MKTYKVTIKGVTPLMHNRFPSPEEQSNKKVKRVFTPKEDARKSLYRDADGKIYQPADHLEGALIKSAVDFKWKGRKTFKDILAREVIIEPQQIPFEIPEDPEKYRVDIRAAVIKATRGRIWVARPVWDNWQMSFKIKVFDDRNLDGDTLKQIVENAGRKVHIGTYRQKFGRFDLTAFEEEKVK